MVFDSETYRVDTFWILWSRRQMALLSQRNQNKHLKQLDFHYHPTLGGSGRSIDGEEPPEFDFLTLECDPAVLKQPEAKNFQKLAVLGDVSSFWLLQNSRVALQT